MNNTWLRKISSIAVMAALLIVGGFAERHLTAQTPNYPGSQAILLPNVQYPAMVFTATSQTKTQLIGGVSTAQVIISGTATACTLQIKATADVGPTKTNYFAIPYFAGVYTSNVPVIVTGAAFPAFNVTAVNYTVNLAGYTGFEIVSSGTFTGTSCTAQVVASSNKGVL